MSLESANRTQAWAIIDGDAVQPTYRESFGFDTTIPINRTGAGEYVLTLIDDYFLSEFCASGGIVDSAADGSMAVQRFPPALNELRVRITDNLGVPFDSDCLVLVYQIPPREV